MLDAQSGGQINLYHNGSKKFETTSYGISVTGAISADNYINIEGGTNPYLRIQDTTNEEYLNLYSSDNESAIVYTQDTFKISSGVDFLNQTPRLTIDSSGNSTFTGNVNITGGTTNGLNITTSGTQDTIKIDRAATSDNAITKYQTASADKWIVGLRNTGDDNFRFYSYGTSSDVLTINQSNGNATFAGGITTTSATGIKIDTTGNAILELDGASGSTEAIIFRHSGTEVSRISHSNSTSLVFSTGSSVTTALTLDTSQNATFAKTVTANGIYTAGNSAIIYKAQRTGGAVAGDWSYDDATTDMSLGTSTAHSFSLKTGNTRALTIDSSQNSTFAGTVQTTQITATNGLNYLKRNTDASLQLRSENTRSGLFITKPATDTVMGSALVLADESYRLGTANYYHMYMLQNGNTYFNQNVGIGATSPSAKISILAPFAAATQAAYIEQGEFNQIGLQVKNTNAASSTTGILQVDNSAGTAFIVNGSGNVGIGVDPSGNTDRLQIDNPANPTSIRIGDNTTDDCYVVFNTDGNDWSIGTDRSDSNKFKISDYSRVGTNDRLVIDGSGNVGIGNTGPQYRLDVLGTSNQQDVLRLQSAWSVVGDYVGMGIGDGWIRNYVENSSKDYRAFAFAPRGTERMRIEAGGNVGIGTTSPTNQLHVHTETDNAYGIRIEGSTNNVAGVWTGLGIGGESANTKSALLFEDTVGSYARGKLHLCVNNGADQTSATPADAKLTIIPSGNVGIGTTSPTYGKITVTESGSAYTGDYIYGGTNGSYGALRCTLSASNSPSFIDFFRSSYSNTVPVGAIVTSGSNCLYQSYSDYRMKENVSELTGALDKVNNIQPKTFNYKEDTETTYQGFIAHELQEVVPQAVSGKKDEVNEDGTPKYQGVDNSHIVPLLVGAIQELKAEIELLKTQINN